MYRAERQTRESCHDRALGDLDETNSIITACDKQASAVCRHGEGVDHWCNTGNETRLEGMLGPHDHHTFFTSGEELTCLLGKLDVVESVSVPVQRGGHFLVRKE